MTQELVLGEAGRIEIPAAVREELHLAEGDFLQLETVDGRIVLSPFHAGSDLRKERGIWVIHSEEQVEVSAQMIRDLIDEDYEERERSILGLKPEKLS